MKEDSWYKIVCIKCDEMCETSVEDNSSCGDPECCGAVEYHIEISCPRCGKKESIYE